MVSIIQTSTPSAERSKMRPPAQSNSAQTQSKSHEVQQRARKRGWLWRGHNKASS